MVAVLAAAFLAEGADMIIQPANAPCMLAAVAASAAGVVEAEEAIFPTLTTGSVKKDQPPP